MDILAFISYLIAMLIFALAGLAPTVTTRHAVINVATGLFFVTLAVILAVFSLTGTTVHG